MHLLPLAAGPITDTLSGMRFLILLFLTAHIIAAEPSPVIQGVDAQVYFSPNGGATDAIVREIAAAKREIRVQAYSFTSNPIAIALRDAKKRGIDVSVILDKSQRSAKYSGADFVANSGIPVVIDEKPAIAHSKVIVIDGATIITGSFNFSSAAESKNVENLLVLRSAELAKAYLANWNERHAISVLFVPKSER